MRWMLIIIRRCISRRDWAIRRSRRSSASTERQSPQSMKSNATSFELTFLVVACRSARKTGSFEPMHRSDETPLHLAAQLGHGTLITLLLEHGADLEAASQAGYTPLHLAAEQGQVEAIKLLVDGGANVGAVTGRDATPLHWAAYHGHAKAFLVLLCRGAQLHARDADGETPMALVQGRGDPEMLRELQRWVTAEKARRVRGASKD